MQGIKASKNRNLSSINHITKQGCRVCNISAPNQVLSITPGKRHKINGKHRKRKNQKIAKILNGAKPRDLGQIFEVPPKIAINLKVAQRIGYKPTLDVLNSADEIYDEIETVN